MGCGRLLSERDLIICIIEQTIWIFATVATSVSVYVHGWEWEFGKKNKMNKQCGPKIMGVHVAIP